MQSLRSRLIVLIVLLGCAGLATGALMIGLFYQSASAQAGQAEAQIARACDAIAATYRFYSAQWPGPSTSLQDLALQTSLTTVVQTALRDRPGIEGGFGVPVAAFTFAHDGPRVDTPPPAVGQHNEEIFAELGLAQRKVS